jgi:hypothetical protein
LLNAASCSASQADGRAVVVNCESKFKERVAGPRGNRRSCRRPLIDEIQAAFRGDNAKKNGL